MGCSVRVMLALFVGILLVIASNLYVSREYLTNSKYCLGTTCVDEAELGQMKTLVEHPSEVWGVGSGTVDSQLYKRPGDGSGEWTRQPQMPYGATAVSVGSQYIWGINGAEVIYKCKRPCTGAWEQVKWALEGAGRGDAQMKQIDVG